MTLVPPYNCIDRALASLTTVPAAYGCAILAYITDSLGTKFNGETIGISLDSDTVYDTKVTNTVGEVNFPITYPGSTGVHRYRLYYPASSGSGNRLGTPVDIDWTTSGDDPYIVNMSLVLEEADSRIIVSSPEIPVAGTNGLKSAAVDSGPRGVTPQYTYTANMLRNTTGSPTYPTDSYPGLSTFPWVDNDPITHPVNGTQYYYKVLSSYSCGGAVMSSYASNIAIGTPSVRATRTIMGFLGNSTQAVFNDIFHTGNAAISGGSVVTGHDGRPGQQYKHIAPTNPGYAVQASSTSLGGTSTAKLVASNYYDTDALPSGTDRIVWMAMGIDSSGSFRSEAAVIRLRPDGFLEAGFVTGTPELQRVQRQSGTVTGGSYTLTFNGQTTGSIAWNASPATVQAALEALSNIDPGDVICGGGPLPGSSLTITFSGQYTSVNVSQITITSSVTGGVYSTATTTQGADPNGGLWRAPLWTTQLSVKRVCPNRYYLIDMYLDMSANPWVLKWSVNNISQPDVTRAIAANTASAKLASAHGFGAVDGSIGTYTTYSADFAVTTDGTQYPLGSRRSTYILPNRIVAASATNATDQAGTAVTAGSSFWQNISDSIIPLQISIADSAANDGKSLRIVTGIANPFITFGFDAMRDLEPDEEIICVNLFYTGYGSSPVPGSTVQARFVVDTSYQSNLLTQELGKIFSASVSNISGGSISSNSTAYGIVPPPTGGWTKTAIDNLTINLKYQNTATSNPGRFWGLSACMIEIMTQRTINEDFIELGCAPEVWGRIAGLRKDA